jgi:hypothetical protein
MRLSKKIHRSDVRLLLWYLRDTHDLEAQVVCRGFGTDGASTDMVGLYWQEDKKVDFSDYEDDDFAVCATPNCSVWAFLDKLEQRKL